MAVIPPPPRSSLRGLLPGWGAAHIAAAAQALLDGGVVLLPTDTVYGLAAHPARPQALAALYRLKERPLEREMPVMTASAADVAALGVQLSAAAVRLLRSPFMPGPLTLILPLGDGDRPEWLRGRREVAVRIPKEDGLRALLRSVGPLLVTSANRHGAPTPGDAAAALASLNGLPALAIDGGARGETPSTIVNCTATLPTPVREGAVAVAELQDYWR